MVQAIMLSLWGWFSPPALPPSPPGSEGCQGHRAGGQICTPSPAPAQEGGEQALLCECWAQGSSIVYSQYLSWLGSPARWRKWGRGRAPNILCIPRNESKASAGAPTLGVTQCEAFCV